MPSNGSIYPTLKEKTDKVKDYLVNTSAKVSGREAWRQEFGCDPATVDHALISTKTFVDFARIIAGELLEVYLTPKIIMEYLNEAIRLREVQNLKYVPTDFEDKEAWKGYDAHVHFVERLEEISRIIANGIARYLLATFAKQVPEQPVSAITQLFTQLKVERSNASGSDSESNEERKHGESSEDPPGFLDALLKFLAYGYEMM